MISATCVASGAAAPQRSFRAGWLALVLALPAGCTDAPVVVPTGPDGALSREILPQAILEGARGTITYIRHEPGAREPWEIWCVDAETQERTRVYASQREVQSVAVNPTCTILFFSMRSNNSAKAGYDAWRANFGQSSGQTPDHKPPQLRLTRVAKESYDETNVSMSADGSVLVWEGEDSGVRVVLGDINGDGKADIIVGAATQPSLSGDGGYLAFVRKETARVDAADYVVWRKHLGSGEETEVARSRNELAHPSPSDGGARVAYLEHDAEFDRVWVTDMNDGTTTEVVSARRDEAAAKVLDHPHLAPDGEFLVYVEYGEPETDGVTHKIFAYGISNHFQTAIDAAVAPAGLFAPYGQTP